jgi:hypothetical protein
MVTAKSPFGWLLAAAAAGRLIVFLLLRQHWGWQPPYHLVYLQPPDWYEPSIGEYLVPHMPLYPAFLRIVGYSSSNISVAAPVAQTALQLLAIARLATTVGAAVRSRSPRAGLTLAFVLGLDPWLCDTAIIMLPAALTGTLFILLVERAAAFSTMVIAERRLPPRTAVIATSAGLGIVGTYVRAEFAGDVALVSAASALTAWLIGAATLRRAAAFAFISVAASLVLVVAALVPRALWLRAKSGTFVLTTNAGGGGLWYGLGEIANPWNIPNPEIGDEPIETFGGERGYPAVFASARSSAFFSTLFVAHVRERPAFLLKLFAVRAHRVMLGWPPNSVSFRGEYEVWPQIGAMGRRLDEGVPWHRLLFDAAHGPWVVKQFGLRYLATAVLWLIPIGAVWYVLRRPAAHPLLFLPAVSFLVGVGAILLVRWMTRYGQQFYWLGFLSAYLMLSAQRLSTRTANRR